MPYCESCGIEYVYMKTIPTDKNRNPKPNPIEVMPSERGNLVIDRTRNLYRFATEEEKEHAAIYNKNLYISHFGNCPKSKEHRRRK